MAVMVYSYTGATVALTLPSVDRLPHATAAAVGQGRGGLMELSALRTDQAR